MSQSSNAQRDPSMDEILASIRKIIEEGDTPPRPVARDLNDISAKGPAANDPARSEATRTAPSVPPVEIDLPPSPRVSVTVSPRTGADIVADFRRPRHPVEPETALSVEAQASIESKAVVEAAKSAEIESALSIEDFEMDLDDAVQTIAPIAVATRPAMLSAAVEKQVTASFSELTEALAARQRPVDLVVEDVLRPMLQEWLDDNLPTLVEKLVREEIERVARGG